MAHSHLVSDLLMSSNHMKFSDGKQVPNRRIDDLCEVWSKHPELVQQFWTILIKRYEYMGEWEVKFQKEVMDKMNLEYVADDNSKQALTAEMKNSEGNVIKVIHRKRSRICGNKGCIAKTLMLVKRDIAKQFNRAAATTHGLTITSVNPTISYDWEGKKKYKKRNIKASEFSSDLHLKKPKVCRYVIDLQQLLLKTY